MGKCDICGKQIKGVAQHKRRMHSGVAKPNAPVSAFSSVQESDSESGSQFIGEIGRIKRLGDDDSTKVLAGQLSQIATVQKRDSVGRKDHGVHKATFVPGSKNPIHRGPV